MLLAKLAAGRKARTAALALAGVLLAAPQALGQSQEQSQHQDWATYVAQENGNQVCYMASKPVQSEGNYDRRGDVFAFVTHRPAEDSYHVVSFQAGYTYKEGSEARLQIGGEEFSLFTEGNMAWARDSETDRKIVEAMRAGLRMTLIGRSEFDTRTEDQFSLRGVQASHNEINQLCNVSY